MKIHKKPIQSADDNIRRHVAVTAADEDLDEFVEDGESAVSDTLDDIADDVSDIQDGIDGIDEDEVGIDLDNNIEGHYIAECERCHGVFISAVMETDNFVEKITGTCPLCDKDTDQYLKWVVKAVDSDAKHG